MNEPYPLKIDAFAHVAPKKFRERLRKANPDKCAYMVDTVPPLYDLDERFRIMDRYENLVQVIAPAWPSVEDVAGPSMALELAQALNDEMAELVRTYPDRFVAAIACLPMND